MRGQLNSLNWFLIVTTLLCSAGCSSSHKTTTRETNSKIPSIEIKKGSLKIDVVYPQEGASRPNVDSNFIFGSVGSGTAQLWINGRTAIVAKNGAFLAFLATPQSGYMLIAKDGSQVDSAFVSFGTREGGSQSDAGGIGGKKVTNPVIALQHPMMATIVTGRDTLATGSDVTPASPEPGADRKWQWPRGTKFLVTAKSGSEYRVQLSKSEDAWVPDSSVRLDNTSGREIEIVHPEVRPEFGYEDLILGKEFGAFLIEAESNKVVVTLYHRTLSGSPSSSPHDALIAGISSFNSGSTVVITVKLVAPLWGYKAFFLSDGRLVVRMRRGPKINQSEPLSGLHVMIDPGHPPGGAIGPTRLSEADANLAIGLRIRDKLLARGALVEMTRTTGIGIVSSTVQSTELWARVDSAVRGDADLLVSIHNNGFPDGVDPFSNYGTSTYYFNDFSEGLGLSLDREIAAVTGVPNLGTHRRSLAMVRPTWMPCVLTESLYMMFPEQEAALRDEGFLDRLAEAHVRGLQDFLRSRLAKP
jgi:N-acetylmuramoyl-L-alanine amidase